MQLDIKRRVGWDTKGKISYDFLVSFQTRKWMGSTFKTFVIEGEAMNIEILY